MTTPTDPTPEHLSETLRYIFRLARVDRADDGTFALHTSPDGMGRVQWGCSRALALAVIAARWGSEAAE